MRDEVLVQRAVALMALLACGAPGSREAESVVQATPAKVSDNGDGTYKNPILCADYSDVDVIRVGQDYYMTASSINMTPGLPVLHSRDLVHWKLIGHGLQKLPPALMASKVRREDELGYDRVRSGWGVWAPSLRHHDGSFWIYWCDPYAGVYMVKARDPAGPWTEPHLVQKALGWIDPCPLWDEETRKAYLVHAYAGSRAGFNSRIDMREMSWDGESLPHRGERAVTLYDFTATAKLELSEDAGPGVRAGFGVIGSSGFDVGLQRTGGR